MFFNKKIDTVDIEYIDKIKSIYKFNYIKFDETIDKIFNLDLQNKKNLIIIDNIFYEKSVFDKDIEELQNFLLKIVEIVFALKNLTENGDMIVSFNTMVFQQTVELYLWLKKHFKESYLYYPEIANNFKRSGLYVIFKGWKEPSKVEMKKLTDYMEEIIKEYPNNVFDFNIIDEKLRKHYAIKKPITNKNIKPIKLLLNLDINDSQFDEIIKFNNNR
jgi:hypothetical protein